MKLGWLGRKLKRTGTEEQDRHRAERATSDTDQKKAEEKGKGHPRDLEFLARTSMQFLELPAEGDIHRLIGERLKEIVGDSFIIVNSFDNASGTTHVRAVMGMEKYKRALSIVGGDPMGMSLKISDEARRELSKGGLVRVPGGLHVLTFGKIPKRACSMAEKLMNIGDIYSMGIARKGELFGNVVIMTRGGVPRWRIKAL